LEDDSGNDRVGLQYFGKRYLNPLLGRWISADPLAIHAPGQADLNVYAYVSGSVLKNVDPVGLEEKAAGAAAGASGTEAIDKVMADMDAQEARLDGRPTRSQDSLRNSKKSTWLKRMPRHARSTRGESAKALRSMRFRKPRMSSRLRQMPPDIYRRRRRR
jgi:RHS repeat-associated protein